MSDDNHIDLAAALTKTVSHAQSVNFTYQSTPLAEALRREESAAYVHAAVQVHDLGKQLDSLIMADPRFPGERPKFIRHYDGSSQVYPHEIGRTLLTRALKHEGPDEAINWMLKVLGTKSATGSVFQALWGVSVDKAIQLTPDVRIAPFATLPDTRQKKIVHKSFIEMRRSPHSGGLGFQEPKAVLVAMVTVDPVIIDGDDLEVRDDNADLFAMHNTLADIALALSAIGPRASLTSAKWFSFDDPDLNEAGMGSGYSWPHIEILPVWPSNYPVLDPVEAPQIVQAYLALPEHFRRHIRVALHRLNQAQRRTNIGDQAVELAIAFEALLGDSQGEMTHKIKSRAARLLGGGDDERVANAQIIGKTYEIRSKLVHSGFAELKKSPTVRGRKMSGKEIVNEAARICADLTKIMIKRGAIPEWHQFDVLEHLT